MVIPQAHVTDLVVHPTDAGTVYASIEGMGRPSLAKTSNGGGSWENLNAAPSEPSSVGDETLKIPSTLYAGGSRGYLYRSTNGGSSWDYTSIYPRPIKDIGANPANPDVILLAAEQAIVYGYFNDTYCCVEESFGTRMAGRVIPGASGINGGNPPVWHRTRQIIISSISV